MKRCFVIMPYGGNDEMKKTHFLGVFQSIITPAAVQAGYEPERSDTSGEPGNISRSIIESLLDSEMVIADMTEANANVFFELGIRHAFRKTGTIHIVDERYKIPFDVEQYRAIKYSDSLSSLPNTIAQIVQAIKKREVMGKSDNPVHDTVPSLPIDIRTLGDQVLREQLSNLQEVLQETQHERDTLAKKMKEVDPSGALGVTSVSVDEILDLADERMRSAGGFVILSLSNAMEGGPDKFVQELRKALKSPNLTLNDFTGIANMCLTLGLNDHRRATLEIARSRFPGEDIILISLAQSYFSSPDPALRENGKILCENYMGVEYADGKPILRRRTSELAGPVTKADKVGIVVESLADFYIQTSRASWAVALAESADKIFPSDPYIIRTKGRSLEEIGRNKEAEEEFKRAISLNPDDDTSHVLYGSFLDTAGRFKEAYEEYEKALMSDNSEGARYLNLAIQVLNRGFYRSEDGSIGEYQSREQRVTLVFPLLIEAVRLRPDVQSEAVSLLVRNKALDEARKLASGEGMMTNLDESILKLLKIRI